MKIGATRRVVLAAALVMGCGEGASASSTSGTGETGTAEPPAAIGPQLRQIEGTWTDQTCASSRLYWDGEQVQHQCFDKDGAFAWENRGTLTKAAAEALTDALAEVDLDATEPVNYEGGCAAADSQGTITLWIEQEPVEFAPDCIFEGIEQLYGRLQAIGLEVSSCEAIAQLVSVEPSCRPH